MVANSEEIFAFPQTSLFLSEPCAGEVAKLESALQDLPDFHLVQTAR